MGLAEREAEMQELETSRPGRSRDLFGVQLEVIASEIFVLYEYDLNDDIIRCRYHYSCAILYRELK